nr:hypothetical protein [Planctomycetota bacterium]
GDTLCPKAELIRYAGEKPGEAKPGEPATKPDADGDGTEKASSDGEKKPPESSGQADKTNE